MSKKHVYSEFRDWQFEDETVHRAAQDVLAELMIKCRPKVVIQVEGRSLLDVFPEDSWHYHVSEEANRKAVCYSIEAEQGYMPFPDGVADLIILDHSLELYSDQEKMFSEASRVLAPGGCILLVTFAKHWLGAKLPSRYCQIGSMRLSPLSVKKIKVMLAKVGLSSVEEKGLSTDNSMAYRLKKQVMQPMCFVIEKQGYQWQTVAGGVLS